MKILHISDTHGKHHLLQDLPPADVIVHSGDVSLDGEDDEVMDFIEWFGALPYKYKVFIAGNHDHCLHDANIEGMPENCFFLNNSGVTIEGVKFYGMPMSTVSILSGNYENDIQNIPADTNVLITHQPPYCILDLSEGTNYGDHDLLQKVLAVQPKCHLFGHVHGAYGIEKNDNTLFVNAAILNKDYAIANKAVLLEL